jgi:polar amino acid transport system substrate-binding protein
MRRLRVFATVAGLLLLVSSSAFAKDVTPQDLVYLCEDVIPSNYLDNGEQKGISIEMLRLMWKRMGVPPQQIKVVPWARGYDAVLTNKNHVLFTMSRTKERETLFKWVGPVYTVRNILIGRVDRKFSIKTLEDAKKFRIGTIKEDVLEKFLLGNNFDVGRVEGVSNLDQSFEKLKAGRVDLIAFSEPSLREFMKEKKYDSKDFKAYYTLSESKLNFAFNKETPDYLIQRFQKAFDSLKKEHKEILKKYGITP